MYAYVASATLVGVWSMALGLQRHIELWSDFTASAWVAHAFKVIGDYMLACSCMLSNYTQYAAVAPIKAIDHAPTKDLLDKPRACQSELLFIVFLKL